MPTRTAFQGYISPAYTARLIDPNTGHPVDLTTATQLTMYLQSQATLITSQGTGTWTITDAKGGAVSYQWGKSDLTNSGLFTAFITLQIAGEPGNRAFQQDVINILAFPGVVIVAEQDVNLNQVNGNAISTTNPVPVSAADGAISALGTTSDTAYTGAGSAGLVGLFKGAYTVLSAMLAKLSILVSTAGYVAAYSGNGASTGTAEYIFKWGNGTTSVNRWILQNNSANPIQFELDSTVGAGSLVLPAGQAYTDANLPISAVHLLATVDTPVNGNAGSNIVIRGWI